MVNTKGNEKKSDELNLDDLSLDNLLEDKPEISSKIESGSKDQSNISSVKSKKSGTTRKKKNIESKASITKKKSSKDAGDITDDFNVLDNKKIDQNEIYTPEEINKGLAQSEEDNWILLGPPTLNDPTSVRDPVDILVSYRDEKGKTIVTDKILGAVKKRFNTISEIATLPNTDELIKLSGIGEQTALKIWKISQQYHNLNAKTASTIVKQQDNILYCSTGSEAVNNLLGGGIATKAITEFFGEAGMGKTQICYTAAVFALLPKSEGGFVTDNKLQSDQPRVIWIDTEGTFKGERIQEIVENRYPNKKLNYFLDNIVVYQVVSTDMLLNAVNEAFNIPDNVVMIIIDSLMALFRFEFSHGISELSRRQNKLQEILGIIKRNMMIKNIAMLMTNQATTKMTMAGPISITTVEAAGGFAVAHSVTHRIKLTRKSAGKNKGIVLRKATVTDSPYLSAGEAEFILSSEGVNDFQKISQRSTKSVIDSSDDTEYETEDDIEDEILS
ncbi:MAG: hypothetical protein ACFFD1_04115 [Candidatus Thorarchaeota archaeon]